MLRSGLFLLLLAPWTLLLATLISLAALLPLAGRFFLLAVYRRGVLWVCRRVLGISWEVRGAANLPAVPTVVFAKHQSAWETLALQELLPPPGRAVFVMKKELLYLPLFGWGLAALRMIPINRRAGRAALAQLLQQGRQRLAAGFWVIVFPEGTRVPPGERRPYRHGAARLALASGAPLLPVAHRAGECWPRNAFRKHAGHIVVSIGPPLYPQPGDDEDTLTARAAAWVEAEMARLPPARAHG